MHLHTTALLLSAAAAPWADSPAYRDAVRTLLANLTADMRRGIDAYISAPHTATRTAQKTIWQNGSSRLLQYPQKRAGGAPVLIIPSLINRADILNLDDTHSFTAYLAGHGFDVYTLDWGAPSDTEAAFTINDYITTRLLPALDHLHKTTGAPPHVIGYCMGGTIAAAHAAIAPHHVRTLTMLAAPWDFHAADKTLSLRMQAYLMTAAPVMAAKGVLPVDWIQMLFASIDPLFAFNKFRHFAALAPESDDARRFVIVEDWLNDGIDLAAPAATQVLQEWYIGNQPANGVWTIGAHLVDTAAITAPVLVVAAGNDRLVPPASASAFMQQNESVTRITPGIGHIGMMASPRAVESVWAPVAAWLRKHCDAA